MGLRALGVQESYGVGCYSEMSLKKFFWPHIELELVVFSKFKSFLGCM